MAPGSPEPGAPVVRFTSSSDSINGSSPALKMDRLRCLALRAKSLKAAAAGLNPGPGPGTPGGVLELFGSSSFSDSSSCDLDRDVSARASQAGSSGSAIAAPAASPASSAAATPGSSAAGFRVGGPGPGSPPSSGEGPLSAQPEPEVAAAAAARSDSEGPSLTIDEALARLEALGAACGRGTRPAGQQPSPADAGPGADRAAAAAAEPGAATAMPGAAAAVEVLIAAGSGPAQAAIVHAMVRLLGAAVGDAAVAADWKSGGGSPDGGPHDGAAAAAAAAAAARWAALRVLGGLVAHADLTPAAAAEVVTAGLALLRCAERIPCSARGSAAGAGPDGGSAGPDLGTSVSAGVGPAAELLADVAIRSPPFRARIVAALCAMLGDAAAALGLSTPRRREAPGTPGPAAGAPGSESESPGPAAGSPCVAPVSCCKSAAEEVWVQVDVSSLTDAPLPAGAGATAADGGAEPPSPRCATPLGPGRRGLRRSLPPLNMSWQTAAAGLAHPSEPGAAPAVVALRGASALRRLAQRAGMRSDLLAGGVVRPLLGLLRTAAAAATGTAADSVGDAGADASPAAAAAAAAAAGEAIETLRLLCAHAPARVAVIEADGEAAAAALMRSPAARITPGLLESAEGLVDALECRLGLPGPLLKRHAQALRRSASVEAVSGGLCEVEEADGGSAFGSSNRPSSDSLGPSAGGGRPSCGGGRASFASAASLDAAAADDDAGAYAKGPQRPRSTALRSSLQLLQGWHRDAAATAPGSPIMASGCGGPGGRAGAFKSDAEGPRRPPSLDIAGMMASRASQWEAVRQSFEAAERAAGAGDRDGLPGPLRPGAHWQSAGPRLGLGGGRGMLRVTSMPNCASLAHQAERA